MVWSLNYIRERRGQGWEVFSLPLHEEAQSGPDDNPYDAV